MIGQSGRSLDAASVTVGMTVYDFAADCDPDTYMAGRGGIVVAVDTHVDPDTGEIQRRFIVCEPYRHSVRFHPILADDVEQVIGIDRSSVRFLIRCLGDVVGRSRGTFTTNEVRAMDAQVALMRALST